MRAIVIARPGGPDVLQLKEIPDPQPQRGEALVRVMATAINRADVLQRMGKYPPPSDCLADVPGLEFAGVVESIASGVSEVKEGDRVFGLIGGGSYCERVVVHARTLIPIPGNLSFVEAAAVPEAFITAYDAMVLQCGLTSGETILISAVGSGVGTAAIQIACAIGATGVGTARSKNKIDTAKELGLHHAIVLEDEKFAKQVLEVTDGRGVDVVLELVGGDYLKEDVSCTARKGRIIIVGLLRGAKAELDMGQVLSKRLRILGTTLRARPIEEKIQVSQSFARHVIPMFESGRLKPVVDKVFKLDEAAAAHTYMESNSNFGKIILSMDEP